MNWLDVVSRVVHVGTAITLVGGSVFTLLVLWPAMSGLADETRLSVAQAVSARWKRFVHIGVTLFTISGLYNYYRAIPLHKGDGLYHGLLGAKMLLALGVFFLAAALVGRSPALQRIRDQRTTWLKVLVLLATLIVCVSGFLKVRGIVDIP